MKERAHNEERGGNRRFGWGLFALLFIAQLGFIFWLGDVSPPPVQPAGPIPVLRLASGQGDLLRLDDPTLFALPHARGFSGEAWLRAEHPGFPLADWSEPERWLALKEQVLGAALREFISTNPPPPPLGLPPWIPEWTKAGLPGPVAPAQSPSTLEVTGDLAGRGMSAMGDLPSWEAPDLLTNTVIQVLVDGRGLPLSSAVLFSGCGHPPADRWALERAREARFAPLPGAADADPAAALSQLAWGRLVFAWRSLPEAKSAGQTP